MMKKAAIIILFLASFLPMLFVHSCANTTEAPSGGQKDTIPPVIVMIDPLPGETNFPLEKGKVVFTFDEYVSIKTPTNIVLSPPPAKPVTSTVRGRSVVVEFNEPLQENTTYTINFPDAIADVNEGNLHPGYTYVFSTGDQIDSLYITGVVRDASTLNPHAGARVLLYKDHSDSAIFKSRPYAAAITDKWGFFAVSFVEDTLYRLYALDDANNDFIYDPATEQVGFIDSLIRPVHTVNDTVKELMKYDMTDTIACKAREAEYDIQLFKERNRKQQLNNTGRVSDRVAYISFTAWDAWIDTLWVGGYPSDRVITQFNRQMDSLEIWINDLRPVPDTLHLFVNYRKTSDADTLMPFFEEVKLVNPVPASVRYSRSHLRNLKHEDTTCVFSLEAKPENVEQNGIIFKFPVPLISEQFDSVELTSLNVRQVRNRETFKVERDSMNLLQYVLRPDNPFNPDWEYILRVPQGAFRDINGFYSDSLRIPINLPKGDALSKLVLNVTGCRYSYVVELMDQNRRVLRTYEIDSDRTLTFPYLEEGSYSIRIFEDRNGNALQDAGSLLEHKQSEKVKLVVFDEETGGNVLNIPPSAEVEETVDLEELFKD